jgi:hypothetical protein
MGDNSKKDQTYGRSTLRYAQQFSHAPAFHNSFCPLILVSICPVLKTTIHTACAGMFFPRYTCLHVCIYVCVCAVRACAYALSRPLALPLSCRSRQHKYNLHKSVDAKKKFFNLDGHTVRRTEGQQGKHTCTCMYILRVNTHVQRMQHKAGTASGKSTFLEVSRTACILVCVFFVSN